METSEIIARLDALMQGKLPEKETCELFQHLVDSGVISELPPGFMACAMDMIDRGFIKVPQSWLQ